MEASCQCGAVRFTLPAEKPSGIVIPGYTTQDDAGDDGDDTIHSPIPYYRVPNCLQALISTNVSSVPEKLDLVYIEFLEPHLNLASKFVQLNVDFAKDSEPYMPGFTLTDLMLDWVKENWKCE